MQYVSGTPSLVDRSRHYAGDPSAAPNPIWTDAEHKVSINIAYDDLLETARRIGGRTWGHKIGYITTVAGTETYTLPSDFVAMLSLACFLWLAWRLR